MIPFRSVTVVAQVSRFNKIFYLFLTFSFDYFFGWYKTIEISLIDFHGSSIENDPQKNPKMQTFSFNGFEWHGMFCRHTESVVSETFEINSKHFISLTCEKASRICLFRRNQFEQFPCDRVCTKKFKTTSKNCFRRYFSLTLSVLYKCLRKQLKLKNYTQRLRWYWEAINLCGCSLSLVAHFPKHIIASYFSGIIVIISIQLPKKSVQFTKINLFGNGKWMKVENRIGFGFWFECRLFDEMVCQLRIVGDELNTLLSFAAWKINFYILLSFECIPPMVISIK